MRMSGGIAIQADSSHGKGSEEGKVQTVCKEQSERPVLLNQTKERERKGSWRERLHLELLDLPRAKEKRKDTCI